MNGKMYESYCGLYCGACEVLLAYQKGEPNDIALRWNKDPSELKCNGCKSDLVFVNCRDCKIKLCAREKGVDFCFECKEYPCAYYKELNTYHEQLPHLKIINKNQETIKNDGLEKWLETQEYLWKCPECGERFGWYTKKCNNCSRELDDLKEYNNL